MPKIHWYYLMRHMPDHVVCFDLGGVLVRVARTWGEALAAAQLSIFKQEVAGADLTEMAHFAPYQAGGIGGDQYYAELANYLGLSSAAQAEAAHNGILVAPYERTEDLVASLHGAGLRTGCLSNTNEPHWNAMATSGRFPAIAALQCPVLSHVAKLEKPDERFFRHFEATVGAEPSQIVYFDDLVENVEAGLDCGWRAYRIDPNGDTAAQMRAVLSREGVLPTPNVGSLAS